MRTPRSEPLLLANDQTNTGGSLWSACRLSVYPHCMQLDFLNQSYTLPIKHIKMLRSGGRRNDRYVEIIHDSPLAPEILRVLPLRPSMWYDTFESLDMPTEDAAGLRHSKKLRQRSPNWFGNAEGLFWLALILAGVAIELIRWCWEAMSPKSQP